VRVEIVGTIKKDAGSVLAMRGLALSLGTAP
jgi:hypothetical protein